MGATNALMELIVVSVNQDTSKLMVYANIFVKEILILRIQIAKTVILNVLIVITF